MNTSSPCATSQAWRRRWSSALGRRSCQTVAPRPDGRSRVSRSWARMPVGERLQVVQLADVVAGHHHRELEALEAGLGQAAHGAERGRDTIHGRAQRR